MKEKRYFVYILANSKRGTLYVGVTHNLCQRVLQHKNKTLEGFTKKYNVTKLVYFEETDDVSTAIYREKQLKKYRRKWKCNLIEEENQRWRDLFPEICLFTPEKDPEINSG